MAEERVRVTMYRKTRGGLLAALLASVVGMCSGPAPALAQPGFANPPISTSVAVCDQVTGRCLKPNADGSIAVTGGGGGSSGSVSNGSDAAAPTSTNQGVVSYNELFNGTSWDRWYGTVAGGARVTPVASSTGGADVSGTVTTSGTYQTLQAANAVRKGCLIQNIDTVSENVRMGTTPFTILSGATISCASGLIVNGDAVAITSATAGAKFSAVFQ